MNIIDTLQTGIITAIRPIVAREISVSRHHHVPVVGAPEIPVHHSTIVLRGFRRVFNWVPIMPRGAYEFLSFVVKKLKNPD